MAEQRTHKPLVGSSNLPPATNPIVEHRRGLESSAIRSRPALAGCPVRHACDRSPDRRRTAPGAVAAATAHPTSGRSRHRPVGPQAQQGQPPQQPVAASRSTPVSSRRRPASGRPGRSSRQPSQWAQQPQGQWPPPPAASSRRGQWGQQPQAPAAAGPVGPAAAAPGQWGQQGQWPPPVAPVPNQWPSAPAVRLGRPGRRHRRLRLPGRRPVHPRGAHRPLLGHPGASAPGRGTCCSSRTSSCSSSWASSAVLATLLDLDPGAAHGQVPGLGLQHSSAATSAGTPASVTWLFLMSGTYPPFTGWPSGRPARARPLRPGPAHRPVLGHPHHRHRSSAPSSSSRTSSCSSCWVSWSGSCSCSRGCRCSSMAARRTSSTPSWAAICAGRPRVIAYLFLHVRALSAVPAGLTAAASTRCVGAQAADVVSRTGTGCPGSGANIGAPPSSRGGFPSPEAPPP